MPPLIVCKRFRYKEDVCFIMKAQNGLYQNWYDVRKDDFGDWYPSSTAGLFDSLDKAVTAMKKHRPIVEEGGL